MTQDESGGLRDLANEARYDGQTWYAEEEFVGRSPECCDCGCPVMTAANRKAEAEYIAAASPDVVLALLDRLEATEAAVARVRTACATWDETGLDRVREALDGPEKPVEAPESDETAEYEELRRCEGCGEDYDPFSESHIGHAAPDPHPGDERTGSGL